MLVMLVQGRSFSHPKGHIHCQTVTFGGISVRPSTKCTWAWPAFLDDQNPFGPWRSVRVRREHHPSHSHLHHNIQETCGDQRKYSATGLLQLHNTAAAAEPCDSQTEGSRTVHRVATCSSPQLTRRRWCDGTETRPPMPPTSRNLPCRGLAYADNHNRVLEHDKLVFNRYGAFLTVVSSRGGGNCV